MSRWYGGCWRTEDGIRRHRESKRRNYRPEDRVARNSRRVRMSAGGIQFYLGQAPTAEAAQQLRRKIREEAPNGAVQQP